MRLWPPRQTMRDQQPVTKATPFNITTAVIFRWMKLQMQLHPLPASLAFVAWIFGWFTSVMALASSTNCPPQVI